MRAVRDPAGSASLSWPRRRRNKPQHSSVRPHALQAALCDWTQSLLASTMPRCQQSTTALKDLRAQHLAGTYSCSPQHTQTSFSCRSSEASPAPACTAQGSPAITRHTEIKKGISWCSHNKVLQRRNDGGQIHLSSSLWGCLMLRGTHPTVLLAGTISGSKQELRENSCPTSQQRAEGLFRFLTHSRFQRSVRKNRRGLSRTHQKMLPPSNHLWGHHPCKQRQLSSHRPDKQALLCLCSKISSNP